jgi:hypothetical protein
MARLLARPRRFARELRALPARAKVALVLALALTVSLLAGVGAAVTGGDDPPADDGGSGAMPSTTMARGDLDIDVPGGWQEVPIPALGVGLALPPGWEAVRLDADGLASLAGASPAVPGFTESAHDALEQGGVFYAAGEDDQGRISDVMLRGAPETGVSDLAGLETYAGELADAAGASDASIEPVDGAERPTVRLDFQVGGDDETAEGTEVLVLGADGLVWSLVVTSDDAAIHDDLVTSLADTFTLASPEP